MIGRTLHAKTNAKQGNKLLFLVLCLSILVQLPLGADQTPVARVNQSVITRAHLQWAITHSSGINAASDIEIQKKILEQLINRELLFQESVKKGMAVADSEIETKKAQLAKNLKTDMAGLGRKTSLTMDDINQEVRKDLAVEKLLARTLPPIHSVSDEEARSYYNSHSDMFRVQGAVRARHILIKADPKVGEPARTRARERIAAVLDMLRAGGDFAELAEQYSEDPSAFKGGDTGFVNRGQKLKAFEDALFSLDVGQVSPVIETPMGYHLILVTERKPPYFLDDQRVEKVLKTYLRKEKQQSQIRATVNQLKSASDIRRYVP